MIFPELLQQTGLIAAHRGFRGHYPENSLCAFEASLGRCHFVELDVQLSSDGIPVIIHDETLGRTSNAAEIAKKIGRRSLKVDEWTLAELRLLDMGSWYLQADPFHALANKQVSVSTLQSLLPQKILTLEEILQWSGKHHLPLNVEIKDHHKSRHDITVVPAVMDVIDRANATELVLISSFNHDYLHQCHALNPAISLGVLQEKSHPPDLIDYLRQLHAAAYHPCETITDSSLINTLRAEGLAVNVYTVNDPLRRRELFAENVTAIFTDFPDLR